jgi:hypothetical protein
MLLRNPELHESDEPLSWGANQEFSKTPPYLTACNLKCPQICKTRRKRRTVLLLYVAVAALGACSKVPDHLSPLSASIVPKAPAYSQISSINDHRQDNLHRFSTIATSSAPPILANMKKHESTSIFVKAKKPDQFPTVQFDPWPPPRAPASYVYPNSFLLPYRTKTV